MKKYTIGIYFNEDLSMVLLLLKAKPEWQKGRYNFPGGKREPSETDFDRFEHPNRCVSREFFEETSLDIPPDEWSHIGCIEGNGYTCEVLTACRGAHHGVAVPDKAEPLRWFSVDKLPLNRISNIQWLMEFALNWHRQGLNGQDKLVFGTFKYN